MRLVRPVTEVALRPATPVEEFGPNVLVWRTAGPKRWGKLHLWGPKTRSQRGMTRRVTAMCGQRMSKGDWWEMSDAEVLFMRTSTYQVEAPVCKNCRQWESENLKGAGRSRWGIRYRIL